MVSFTSFHPVARTLRFMREIPLVWFLLGCLFAKICASQISGGSEPGRERIYRRIAFGAGLLVLCLYGALSVASLHCFLMQGDEANILSISAAGIHGLPIYNSPRSPDTSYSLMYGPLTFLVYRLALMLGGVSHFWVIRSFVVIANLSVCAALYLLLRKFISVFAAVALMAFPISVLMQHPENSLGLRSDIWIFLFSTLAITCSFLETESVAVLLVGLMGGLIVGFKITAGSAILLPLLLLYRKFGLRSVITSSLVAIAVTFLPFTLPEMSLHNYISWLLFTRAEGLSPLFASENLAFALFLISPSVLIEISSNPVGSRFRKRLPEFLVIVFCLILAILTSKNGSGPHYLWHIVPAATLYPALVLSDSENSPLRNRISSLYYIAVACALFACVNLPRAWQNTRQCLMPPGMRVAEASIDRYLDFYRNRSSLQVGYGYTDGDYRSEIRYIPIYRGQPYTIEGNTARFETRLLPFPINVLKQMETCKDDVWLIPHPQKPFEVWVLTDSLRTTFLQNYSIDRSDGVYDAWVCNHTSAH